MQKKKIKAKVLSVYELMQKFPNEEVAKNYLKGIIWADGAVCPFCGSKNHNMRENDTMFCADCRESFTIRTNTIFHRSHIPLHKWLYAMYLIVTARKGISSLQLSKEIGITQKSAWFMLQRIRVACGNQIKKILSGIVEADETYLGGLEKNKRSSKKLNAGGGTVGKTPIFGMMDRNGNVVAHPVLDTTTGELCTAIRDNVDKNAIICTDEYRSYNDLDFDFDHRTVNHSAKLFVDGMAHTNSIESVWAVLKRGFYGIYHSFSRKHTGLYIDEFVFRLNEGNVKIDTSDRLKSLVGGIVGKRLMYKQLIRCYAN